MKMTHFTFELWTKNFVFRPNVIIPIEQPLLEPGMRSCDIFGRLRLELRLRGSIPAPAPAPGKMYRLRQLWLRLQLR